jgi:hypothetical protein
MEIPENEVYEQLGRLFMANVKLTENLEVALTTNHKLCDIVNERSAGATSVVDGNGHDESDQERDEDPVDPEEPVADDRQGHPQGQNLADLSHGSDVRDIAGQSDEGPPQEARVPA